MAAAPRSTAGRSLKAPPNLPIGVRAPATITDLAVTSPCYLRSAGPEVDLALVGGHADAAGGVWAEVGAPCPRQGTPRGSEIPDRVRIQVPPVGCDNCARVGGVRERDRDIAQSARVDVEGVATRREGAREYDVGLRLQAGAARHGHVVEPNVAAPAVDDRGAAHRDMLEPCSPVPAPDEHVAVHPANRQVAQGRDFEVGPSRYLHSQVTTPVEGHAVVEGAGHADGHPIGFV